jgi:hypothetical protein
VQIPVVAAMRDLAADALLEDAVEALAGAVDVRPKAPVNCEP